MSEVEQKPEQDSNDTPTLSDMQTEAKVKSEESTSSDQDADDKSKSDSEGNCMIIIGMAGAGKTTFIQKLNEHLWEQDKPPYVINVDPACVHLPYPANIDIRDTIDYKKVMKEYDLGPNGAIMTSMNLFSTKFHQLVELIESRRKEFSHVIFDTPGQIEVFNWSASGMIMTETLASLMPTVLVYVLDTVRNVNPSTFMANMLYVCSIVFKAKLPLVVVFNKTDLVDHNFLIDWMTDFDKFEEALEGEHRYVTNLTRSLALVLDIFYEDLKRVAVSSVTGAGFDEFLNVVQEARQEYLESYVKGGDGNFRVPEAQSSANAGEDDRGSAVGDTADHVGEQDKVA